MPHAPRWNALALVTLLGLLAVVGTAATSSSHVRVRPGQTLSGLARQHHTTVSALQQLNGLHGTGIYAGELLALPGRRSTGDPAEQAASGVAASVTRSAARHRAQLRGLATPGRAQVKAMVASTARRYGVDPVLAVSLAFHESGFQQRVVSVVDAIGVMQVLPSTGRVLAGQFGRRLDLLRTQDNITAGVLLLRQLRRATGSDAMTLAGYYQGLGSIARIGLLPQTHRYVQNVTALRARFRSV